MPSAIAIDTGGMPPPSAHAGAPRKSVDACDDGATGARILLAAYMARLFWRKGFAATTTRD